MTEGENSEKSSSSHYFPTSSERAQIESNEYLSMFSEHNENGDQNENQNGNLNPNLNPNQNVNQNQNGNLNQNNQIWIKFKMEIWIRISQIIIKFKI